MLKSNHPDDVMAVLAARQHGNVTRRQLLEAGLTDMQILHRLRTGHLRPRFRGVYVVGHVPPAPHSRAAAAVLACGPQAALSHRSAAVLWGVFTDWREPLEVTVPGKRVRPGIRVHRCATLTREDVTTQWGIRTTSPARTLLAIAPGLSPLKLARAYNDLRRASFLRAQELRELLERLPAAPAARRLRALLTIQGGPTRSELEDAFCAFVDAHGLPRPHTNVMVGGYEVDMYYPHQRVIVELDSLQFHLTAEAFHTDRERDAHALAHGIRTIRLTHERIKDTPAREAARLRQILA